MAYRTFHENMFITHVDTQREIEREYGQRKKIWTKREREYQF